MKASLKIEAIGDDQYQYMRLWTGILNDGMPGLGNVIGCPPRPYWVARIIGFDPKYKYVRDFLRPKKDYAQSNSKGSRGVFLWYILENGYVYQVSSPKTWKKIDRYYCIVKDDGKIQRISEEQVNQWIKDHSVSMF